MRQNAGSLAVVLVAITTLLLVVWLPSVSYAGSATASSSATRCVVGTGPEFPGYDPVNHEMYVPNGGSANISILSGTCTHVGSISLPSGAHPVYAAFDPQNDHMYVTDYALNQVYVIAGKKIVTTITGFHGPWGEVWDPGDGLMIVANGLGNTVTTIFGTTLGFSVQVGSLPDFVGYDPYWSTLLVSNFGSGNITFLNALNPMSKVATVTVGGGPGAIVFDPVDSWDYVADQGSTNVSELYGNGGLAGTVSGFKSPAGIAFNQANLRLYVASSSSSVGKVQQLSGSLIDGSNNTASGAVVTGVAFDEFNNYIYVTNSNSNCVYILT